MSRFYAYAELLGAVLLGLVIVTQILWPAMKGTALFPVFRRERRIRSEIVEAAQEREERELEKTLAEMRGPASVEPDQPWPRSGQTPAESQQQEQKNA